MPAEAPDEAIQTAYQLMEVAEANASLAVALAALRRACEGYVALLGDPYTKTFDPEAPPIFEHLSATIRVGMTAEASLRAWTEILLNRLEHGNAR